MIKKLLAIGVIGFLSSGLVIAEDSVDGHEQGSTDELLMAGNPRQERRGGRQDHRDDKQDCRQEEGRVGDDKRDCKQDARGGDDGAEADGAEAEA